MAGLAHGKAHTFEKGLGAVDSDGTGLKIGIVRAKWNEEVTGNLLTSAVKELTRLGVKKEDISVCECPGSYEVVYLAQLLATERKVDAVICLGTSSVSDAKCATVLRTSPPPHPLFLTGMP